MDEKQFWSMIEDAWQCVDRSAEVRRELAQGKLSFEDESLGALAQQATTEFVPALQGMLEELPAEDLLQFDRILERKLYDIDRADIHEHTDGSDDGFLYNRGFIVAAGRAYFEAVSADPTRALLDLECEDLCYLPTRVYAEKFGDPPDSGISRETGANKAGWQASDGDDDEG